MAIKKSKISRKTTKKPKIDLEKAIEKNRTVFDYYSNELNLGNKDPKNGENDDQSGGMDKQDIVGVLTNFDHVEESNLEDEAQRASTDLETEGLTAEELQQKKLEEMREEKKREIAELQKKTKNLTKKLDKAKDMTSELTTKIEEMTSTTRTFASENKELKKETKTKSQVLESLKGNKVLESKELEVEETRKDLVEIQEAWQEQREELETELRKAKREYEAIKGQIMAKEEKIEFYEDNYSNLVAELKTELQNRANLIQEYQTMPKDLSRGELSKMIFMLKGRCEENRATTEDKIEELKELEEKFEGINKGLVTQNLGIMASIGEGENKKKKKDDTFDRLRDCFKRLCQVHDDTKAAMVKYGEQKIKVASLENEILDLKKNNYKETADRLKAELSSIGTG